MALTARFKDFNKLKREFSQIDKVAAKVEKYTLIDIRKRAPGIVSTATSKIYKIKKNEVARARTKNASKYAGKQHVSTGFRGLSLDDFVMVFRGRKTATWDTKAKPKPKPPMTGNPKVFSTKRKYRVTTEVFRGKPAVITPTGGNRVFVAMVGGKLRPMVVGASNKPRVKASTSVPQAIMNEQTVAIWRPELDNLVIKRFEHHSKRYWAGEI